MRFNQHPVAFISGRRQMLPNDFPFITTELFTPQKMIAPGCSSKLRNLIPGSRHDILNGASNNHEVNGKDGWGLNSRMKIGATRRREGSARESKKDYLHFLYISRGSLSETQYFIHLASRLNYLAGEEAETFIGKTKQVFACLHGLIKAVEGEAGRFNKIVATITSLLVLALACWSSSQ
jgi:23S rRNA-intervening sequence protein